MRSVDFAVNPIRGQGADLMKDLLTIGVATLLLSVAAPVSASPESREYHRGYYDCLAGRYDQERDGRAYREGCRAAQRERDGEDEGEGPGGRPWREPPPGGPDDNGPGYNGPGDGRPGFGGPGENGPGYGGPPVAPRTPQPVGIPNVKGMEPGQALAAMASRGYRNVGTTVVGAGIFSIYFNPMTRECVQLANANGRVIDAREIGSNPRCR